MVASGLGRAWGRRDMIYLDYSANTPVDPGVLECYCRAEQRFIGNPNSLHLAGREARAELGRVTEGVAALLGVHPVELIYTSGASESNNLAIKGVAGALRPMGRHLISTPLEHSSVSASLAALVAQGYQLDVVEVHRDGKVNLEHLGALMRGDTVLVAVCAVDSELGVIQPIDQIAALLGRWPNCHLHVDATQAVGKIPLSLSGVGTMSFAPHKFYGLNGSGLLFRRRGLALEPQIHGGSSATPLRSGTPALAHGVALDRALELALENQTQRFQVVAQRNATLRKALGTYPRVRLNTPEDAVPHILNLSVEGVKATVFHRALDEQGVCVSVQSACSRAGGPSRAVLAISGDRKNALSSWRISLSHLTTPGELEAFLVAFAHCYHALCP